MNSQNFFRIFLVTVIPFYTGCLKFSSDSNDKIQAVSESIHVGRFQLVQLGTMRRDQFLLDTATGKVWASVCAFKRKGSDAGDCDYSVWEPRDIIDISINNEEVRENIKIFSENK